MDLFIISYLSGIFSGCISVFFRIQEIKNGTYTFGKQFFLQIVLFVGAYFLFKNMFAYYTMNIFGMDFSWFFIFFLVMNLSYYQVKIAYEWITGFSLYPSEKELEEYINKKNNGDF